MHIQLTLTSLLFLFLLPLTHSQPQLQPVPCPKDIPDTICHRLQVPLDHANPNGRTIPFLFARVQPSTPIPLSSEVPIVYLPGGPGQDGLASLFLNISIANAFNRSFIAVDPRGSGTDSKLSCPLSKDFFKGLILDQNFLNEARDCLQELGPDMLYYSTQAIVEDLELMRKAFGYKQLDLFGFSYGTITAQLYVLKYPESVRSMMLDSPRPLNIDIYDRAHPEAYRRIYKARNPDMDFDAFIQTVQAVLFRLRMMPELQTKIGITPKSLRRAYQTVSSVFIKGVNEAMNTNNFSTIKQLLVEESDFEATGVNLPAYMCIICNDLVNRLPWGPDTDMKARQAVLKQRVNELADGIFFPFSNEEGIELIDICTAIPFKQLPREGFPAIPLPQKDIPALLLVGEFDRITPVEDIAQFDPVLRRRTGAVRGAFHTVITTEDACPAELVFEFLFKQSVLDVNKCAPK